MSIRPLELLDLATLSKYRNSTVLLDSTQALTRGNPIGAGNLISNFNPLKHVYTAVLKENGDSLVGCVSHMDDEPFARLLYLAPRERLGEPGFSSLLENLTVEAGSWGAHHVVAEVDETSEAFSALRSSGFSIYARQRFWDITSIPRHGADSAWVHARSTDLPAIQSLYHQIVPPLLQPVEPMPRRAVGYICNQGARCHVRLSSGSMGTVFMPLIHPDSMDGGTDLSTLLGNLPGRGGRRAYLCVRSYQVWLEPVLEDLGALAGPHQVIMVKHLVRLLKEEQPVNAVQPAGVRVQPSRVSRIQEKQDS